jgi:apolipoprotein N-acyltransferase
MSDTPTPAPQNKANNSSGEHQQGRLYNWMWLFSLAAGALMALAFVPYDFGFLVWIGLMPLLTILWTGPTRFWRGFRMGWMFGMGWYCVSFYWIHEVGYVFNIPASLFMVIAFIPLMAVYSCLPGIWGGIVATWLRPKLAAGPAAADIERYGKKSAWRSWAFADLLSTLRAAVGSAALWVCIEWLRAHGTLGFSWNSLGMGMYNGLSLVQWAEFVGTAALSFVPAFINVVLWGAGRRAYLYFKGTSTLCRVWDFYGSMVLLFLMFLGGMFLAKSYSPNDMLQRESTLKLPVLAVQVNQDQRERMKVRSKRLATPTIEQKAR